MSLGSSLIKGSAVLALSVSLILAIQTNGDLSKKNKDNQDTISTLNLAINEANKNEPKTEVVASSQKAALEKTQEFLKRNDAVVSSGVKDKDRNTELLASLRELVVESDSMPLPLFGYTSYNWVSKIYVGGQDSDGRVNLVIDFSTKDGELMASTLLRYSSESEKLSSFSTYYTDAGKNFVQKDQNVVGEANNQ